MIARFALPIYALLAGTSLVTAVSAAETVYNCEATFTTSRGFMMPRVVFYVDEENGTARVLDGIIMDVEGAPVAAQLSPRSDKVHRIIWKVENIPTEAGGLTVSYSANLNHVRNRYTMNATVGGYSNDARSEGRCAIAP